MPAVITKEEVIDRLKKLNNPYITMDMNTYINFTTKCRFIDVEYGGWWTTPKIVIYQKCIHPKRRLKLINEHKTIPVEIIIKRVEKAHGDQVKIDVNTYKGTNKKAKFIDNEFGEFYSLVHHVCAGHSHPKRGIIKNYTPRITPIDEVQQRIRRLHGDSVIIKPETYKSATKRATFVHKEYGEWSTIPCNVMNRGTSHQKAGAQKAKTTCFEKYGVDSPQKDTTIFNKAQRSCWYTYTLEHWKTNKPVLCRGSFEYAVVKMLNENKINYEWQIKFTLLNKIVYFCDLYLNDDNMYVEIKGIFKSSGNKEKWETFHRLYTNSELWQEKEITFLTGKSHYVMKKEFKEVLSGKKIV